MDAMTFFYLCCGIAMIICAFAFKLIDKYIEKKSKKDSPYHFYA